MRFAPHSAHVNRPTLPPNERAERDRQRAAAIGTPDALRGDVLGISPKQVRLLQSLMRGARVRPPAKVMRNMDVLTERGLVELRAWGRYMLTDAGRRALGEALPDSPVWLKKRDGLTTTPGNALLDEGEVVDPSTLNKKWAEGASRRFAEVSDRRRAAQRASDLGKRAA